MTQIRRLGIVMLVLALSGCSGAGHKSYGKRRGAAATMQQQQVTENDLYPLIEEVVMPSERMSFGVKDNKAGNIKNSRANGVYELDSMRTMPVSISARGYTRFSLEDERIADVFVFPQEELQLSIHKQGYLLVLPKVAVAGEEDTPEIYMTITGDDGTTQDMSLRLTGNAPQPVKFVKVNLE